MKKIAENELVLIIYKDRKYLKRAIPDGSFHGRGGMLTYGDLVGRPFGIKYGEYEIYEPTIEDIIMYGITRETQIVFPKDSYFICFRLDVRGGSRILEIGTGSGALTILFSRLAGPEGTVVSFEREDRHFRNAKRNIERFADYPNVELHHGDIAEYRCDEGVFDAVFIDVREPWTVLQQARGLLKASGSMGTIVPTANQVSELLAGLTEGFGHVEVLEIMLRKYKTVAERVRPMDRMIAHTGYLAFARKLDLLGESGSTDSESTEEACPSFIEPPL
jgi:tRNA (adenine57-N1/adenine58-N1)-methyltransferase catalytic subunit